MTPMWLMDPVVPVLAYTVGLGIWTWIIVRSARDRERLR